MEYTLRELECFAAVAEELSFTRAAKRLHLAQPPLSRHIHSLEEKVGARLFERGARSVSITHTGRVFYEESRGILTQLARAGEMAQRAAQGESARLRLGIVSAVLGPKIVEVLREFREAHPQVQIMVHDLPPAEQLAAIAEGRLDAGFVGMAPNERPGGVRIVRWCKERLLAFVPSGHALAHKKTVKLGELRGERFVAISSEAAPAFSLHVHDLCRKAGFRPRIVLESPRAQAVAVMVAAGSGVAILPESLRHFLGDSAAGVALAGSPEITHVFALAQSPPPQPMNGLLKVLEQTAR